MDEAPKPDETTAEELGKGDPRFEKLPTGKPHISFSELRDWKECSYRHKLKFVDKVDLDKPGPLMDFGTAVHAACQKFLETRTMDASIAANMIRDVWEKNKSIQGFEADSVERYVKEASDILADVPAWLEEQFPGWEYVDAEHYLYEAIDGKPHAFKGFIDGIIRCPGPRGKPLTWLLDWKTTGWGWSMWKKSDDLVRTQLVLYKSFWSTKTQTDPKDVRCGFVLLKRSAKPGKHCELVTTSAGDVTTGRSLKVINNMLASVKKGIAIKNRGSCQFCSYYGTPHCT
jgi:hypothetical protein